MWSADRARRPGMARCVAKQGDQTDQETRSAGHRAAVSVTRMDIAIDLTFLPQNDPEASRPFHRDTLGVEGRNDVGYGRMS
jgi:hypothetical protein